MDIISDFTDNIYVDRYKDSPKVEVELRRSRTDASWRALWDWLLAPVYDVDCNVADEGDSSMNREDKDQPGHERGTDEADGKPN